MESPKSSCCKALMRIVGGDEGTNYYECTQCNKACDIYVDDKLESKRSKTFMRYPDLCHCHAGGNYQDCKTHEVLECEHCSQPTPREDWYRQIRDIFYPYAKDTIVDSYTVNLIGQDVDRIVEEITKLLSSQKQELLKKFEEIIGEDQNSVVRPKGFMDSALVSFDEQKESRNDLRAEQRKALEALKEKE